MRLRLSTSLRVATVLIVGLCPSVLWGGHQAGSARGFGFECMQNGTIPHSYYHEVTKDIRPPGAEKFIITITVGTEQKIILRTDGQRFELLAGTPELPQHTVSDFLFNLAENCRLPADPAAAAALIKIKWERKQLEPAQFENLHKQFADALSQYVLHIEQRYPELIASGGVEMYLDAESHSVTYDNRNGEHIIVVVQHNEDRPMRDWIHQLKQLTEQSFGHPVWTP